MKFLPALKNYLKSIQNYEENIVVGGDFNVAPFDIDVYDAKELENSTCFTLQERKLMREILNEWHDLYRLMNPLAHEYSWWDYRAGGFQRNHGMRIDFLLGNAKLADHVSGATIDKGARAKEKASDHAPVVVTLG